MPTQQTNQQVELASRLTLRALGCDPSKVLESRDPKAKLAIARIYGTVSRVGTQEDKTTNNAYVFFVGDFEGVNLLDGDSIRSSKLYLPEGVSQTLEHICNQVHEKRRTALVKFAFEIFVTPMDESRTGYGYGVRTLLQPEQTDLLQAIRDHVNKKVAEEKAGGEKKKTA